jgi:hypothetical protein
MEIGGEAAARLFAAVFETASGQRSLSQNGDAPLLRLLS